MNLIAVFLLFNFIYNRYRKQHAALLSLSEMMAFLIKFCQMELNLQENVKEKIVAPMQGGLVEHAQKQVPVVSNLLQFSLAI